MGTMRYKPPMKPIDQAIGEIKGTAVFCYNENAETKAQAYEPPALGLVISWCKSSRLDHILVSIEKPLLCAVFLLNKKDATLGIFLIYLVDNSVEYFAKLIRQLPQHCRCYVLDLHIT